MTKSQDKLLELQSSLTQIKPADIGSGVRIAQRLRYVSEVLAIALPSVTALSAALSNRIHQPFSWHSEVSPDLNIALKSDRMLRADRPSPVYSSALRNSLR